MEKSEVESETEYETENKMENLSANDIAVGSLLAGNRGGSGAWGGGYSGAPFASPGSNAVRINRNEGTVAREAEFTRTLIGSQNHDAKNSFESLTRGQQFATVAKDTSDACVRINENLTNHGFNTLRESAALSRQLADCCCDNKVLALEAQLKAAECCCETQKEILRSEANTNLKFAAVERQACEDKAQIIAEIKASEGRNIERSLNAANAELTALKTQIACGCGCDDRHHHHHYRGGSPSGVPTGV